MLRASIDLGTNTCLLLMAHVDPKTNRVTRTVEDHATVVRLGQGVDQNRVLGAEPIERTLSCLKNYVALVSKQGLKPQDITAVATSQARDAKNGAEFFERVQAETGIRFRVLSGDQEARATFLGGLLPGQDPKGHAVIDIGGGSTEYMAQSGGKSLDLGSVRFTERYLKSDPVTDPEFWAAREAIDQQIITMKPWAAGLNPGTELVAVAGTATTLAAWFLELPHFDASKIDGAVLTRGDLHRMVEELKWRTLAERTVLPGMEPGRSDVLLIGALILWRSLELLGFRQVTVSSRGLRYGIFES